MWSGAYVISCRGIRTWYPARPPRRLPRSVDAVIITSPYGNASLFLVKSLEGFSAPFTPFPGDEEIQSDAV